MKRRDLLIAAAALVALPARSQQRARLRRLAVVTFRDRESFRPLVDSLLAGLREYGYVEGKSIELDVRYGSGVQEEMPKLLRDALAAKPDVVVVGGVVNARLAKQATTTVPIVVYVMSDPVEAGIVVSFGRPGGNLTGLADLADETTLKRLEFAAAAVPKARTLLLFLDPAFPATKRVEGRLKGAAAALKLPIVPVFVSDRAAVEKALGALDTSRGEVLVAGPTSLLVQNAKLLIDGALARGVPVVHFWTGTAEQGALLSHGVDVHQNLRRSGFYVDRILKGARAGDLPIEQPSKYELTLNLKTAKSLGITVPQAFLARVDRVIE